MAAFLKSFVYALNGIKAFSKGRNARIQLLAAVIVITVAFIFHISPTEWLIILLHIGLVLAAEAMNTSLEKLCDFVTTERLPQIKIIKDMAAGAVLLLSISAFISSTIIFIPKMF